jgi:ribonuclease-3
LETRSKHSDSDESNDPISKHKRPSLPNLPPITSRSLENAVFTHEGLVSRTTNASEPEVNYERLEFLGDAYLEVIASRVLFRRFPHRKAGKLSSMREALIKNDTLDQFSGYYGFPARLKATEAVAQAVQSRLSQKLAVKVSADIFEAYVAAVVLSAQEADEKRGEEKGARTVTKWLEKLWEPQLRAFEEEGTISKDTKQQLAAKIKYPGVKLDYVDAGPPTAITNTPGKLQFSVKILLTGWGYERKDLGTGYGTSKTEAGAMAATIALENQELMEDILQKKTAEMALRKAPANAK